ncbi:hypothetical protein ABK040_009074 [Willaertia magna]
MKSAFVLVVLALIATIANFTYGAAVTNTKALKFAGNAFVNFTSTASVANGAFFNSLSNTSMTLSTWVQYTDIAAVKNYEGIVGALAFTASGGVLTKTSGFGILSKKNAGNVNLVAHVETKYGTTDITANTNLQANNWYFVTLVYTTDSANKQETIGLFVDGVQQQLVTNKANGTTVNPSLSFDSILTQSIDFRLGGGEDLATGSNVLFTGSLDDTKIYNVALSSSYISAQKNSVTLDTAESGLKVYWPFENNVNDVVTGTVNGALSGTGSSYVDHVLPKAATNTTTSPKPSKNNASSLSFGILGLLLSLLASVLLF